MKLKSIGVTVIIDIEVEVTVVDVVAVTLQPEVVRQETLVDVVITFPLSSKIDVVVVTQSVTIEVVVQVVSDVDVADVSVGLADGSVGLADGSAGPADGSAGPADGLGGYVGLPSLPKLQI